MVWLIEEIYTSFQNGNFDQMEEQIINYPGGVAECVETLWGFINEFDLNVEDFNHIICIFFKKQRTKGLI